MSITTEIINYCKSNRVSTTEVADALGKSGVLKDVYPLNSKKYSVGKVITIFTSDNSNYDVHDQIRKVKPNDVVLIIPHKCDDRAIIGDIIAKYILLYQRAEAIIVLGNVRDAARLKKENYSIWIKGITPLGCFNTPPSNSFPKNIKKDFEKNYLNGIAVCDDGGVTIIPPSNINNDMLIKLKRIEMQEDIWSFCLDTLKWDTKKIICDKEYLKDKKLLSDIHIKNLNELKKSFDK